MLPRPLLKNQLIGDSDMQCSTITTTRVSFCHPARWPGWVHWLRLLTQLLLGVLEGLLEAGAGVRGGELKQEAALSRGGGELQLGGQEGHAECKRLLVRQLAVHRRHQVLDHLVHRLAGRRETVIS